MFRIWAKTVIIFAALVSVSSRAHDCSEVTTKEWTYDEIASQLQPAAGIKIVGNALIFNRTEADLRMFLREGWPKLKELAQNNGTSVADLLQPYFSLQAMTTAEVLGDRARLNVKIEDRWIVGVRRMETWAADKKLKAKDWEAIRYVESGLTNLAMHAIALEEQWRKTPSLNPLLAISRDQAEKIIESLENSSLDQAIAAIEVLKAELNPPKPVQTEVQVPVHVPPVIKPVKVVKNSTERLSEQEDRLGVILRAGEPLVAEKIYKARTPYGRELQVTLTRSLMKEYQVGQIKVFHRLLRSIITGTGDKTGIKNLFDIGPNIVELRAVFHGHKRIIGCLEGDRLRLLKFLDLGESLAAYAKSIPRDLCQE